VDESVPGGAGIGVDDLTLHDVHPPASVVESYHRVAQAIQDRDRMLNEAEAAAHRIVKRAEDERYRTEKQAAAEADTKLRAAAADRDAFLAWHAARTKLTPAEETALAAERARRVGAGEDVAAVDRDLAQRREMTLAERRFLIENRLAVQAVVDVLRGRDKVLIDTPAAPGRRHLFLVDPDLIRLPSLAAPGVGEREP
jgi:regulator of protease activity HflC (stomatin/prohibitin superfamily)